MGKKRYIIEIKNFIEKMHKDFVIEKVIFFGSGAIEESRKESDIDLIIVSDDFKKMDFFERVSTMYNYWDSNIPVDFLCYTKNEFEKLRKKVSIISEALKEGIII